MQKNTSNVNVSIIEAKIQVWKVKQFQQVAKFKIRTFSILNLFSMLRALNQTNSEELRLRLLTRTDVLSKQFLTEHWVVKPHFFIITII